LLGLQEWVAFCVVVANACEFQETAGIETSNVGNLAGDLCRSEILFKLTTPNRPHLGHIFHANNAADGATFMPTVAGDIAAWSPMVGNPIAAGEATGVGGVSSRAGVGIGWSTGGQQNG